MHSSHIWLKHTCEWNVCYRCEWCALHIREKMHVVHVNEMSGIYVNDIHAYMWINIKVHMWLKFTVHTYEEVHDTHVNELHDTHLNKVCVTHMSRKYTVHTHEQTVWYKHVSIVQGIRLWTKCPVHTCEWTASMKIYQFVQWICANNGNTHSTFSRLQLHCIFFFIISPFCDIRYALEGQKDGLVAKASCC